MPGREAKHPAMLACQRHGKIGEKMVEIGERPATHQGERTIETPREPREEITKSRRDDDAIGRRRQFDQGSIKIEQKRKALARRQITQWHASTRRS